MNYRYSDEAIEIINKLAKYIADDMDLRIGEYRLLLPCFERVVKDDTRLDFPETILEYNKNLKDVVQGAVLFYKDLDTEFYRKALDILLNLKKQHSFEFFDPDGEMTQEQYSAQNHYGGGMINMDEFTGLKKIFISNCSESYIQLTGSTVHEIAHTFSSFTYTNPFAIMVDKNEYRKRTIRKLFDETTAITIEELFFEKTLKDGKVEESLPKAAMIKRYNDCTKHTIRCYEYLKLGFMMKKKGYIEENDIIESINNMEIAGDAFETIELSDIVVNSLANDIHELYNTSGYALAGLLYPRLIKLYNEKGISVIKNWIKAVESCSFAEIYKVLEIKPNREGLDTLMNDRTNRIYELGLCDYYIDEEALEI